MPSDGIRAKSFGDKYAEIVTDSISGLFSDMFSSKNDNADNGKTVQQAIDHDKEVRISRRLSKGAGQVAGTYMQTQQRILMMKASRAGGPSMPGQNGSNHVYKDDDAAFFLSEFPESEEDDELSL